MSLAHRADDLASITGGDDMLLLAWSICTSTNMFAVHLYDSISFMILLQLTKQLEKNLSFKMFNSQHHGRVIKWVIYAPLILYRGTI